MYTHIQTHKSKFGDELPLFFSLVFSLFSSCLEFWFSSVGISGFYALVHLAFFCGVIQVFSNLSWEKMLLLLWGIASNGTVGPKGPQHPDAASSVPVLESMCFRGMDFLVQCLNWLCSLSFLGYAKDHQRKRALAPGLRWSSDSFVQGASYLLEIVPQWDLHI